VDVTDIIDVSQGIKENSNKIQCDFGTGQNQPARGNHTHTYSLADLSNVSSDTATDGNILSANGSSWESKDRDSAGIVTKTGEQTVSGDKTFSGATTLSGTATFSGATTLSGGVTFSSAAKTSSYVDFEEISAPSNPSDNTARLYAGDNGSGKTQLCVIFPTGASIVIATEA